MKQVVGFRGSRFPMGAVSSPFSPLPWIISVLLVKYYWFKKISKIGFLTFCCYDWVETIDESQLIFFFIEVTLLYHLHGIIDARMTVILALSVLQDLLV